MKLPVTQCNSLHKILLRHLLALVLFGQTILCYAQPPTSRVILRGKVNEAQTGEPVPGASVYIIGSRTGTTTNPYGEYVIWLMPNQYSLRISAVGFNTLEQTINLSEDTIAHHKLTVKESSLDEVIVYGDADHVNSMQLGQNSIDLATLKKIPPLLGEADIIRGLLLMPGITTVGEGATGYNVRGGSVDQNLVTLDDTPIFNTSHLFGFLTAFDSDAILSADLYKGSIPANFGGRVASVLDVKLRNGNANKLSGSAGLGLMSATGLLEGPISPRTTFLFSARTSYSDWLLKMVPQDNVSQSDASFYDGILKVTHKLNEKHQLSLTTYLSNDDFSFPGDTTYGWQTKNASLKLGSTLSDRVFLVSSLIYSDYNYRVDGSEPTNQFRWNAGINYLSGRTDANINISEKHKTDFGLGIEKYRVDLGTLRPRNQSNINPFSMPQENGAIFFGYLSHNYDVHPKLQLRAGLRYSIYQLYGPALINHYEEGRPKSEATFLETQTEMGMVATYNGAEPRLSLRYSLGNNSSIKAGVDRTVQYLQLISNTTAVSPIDLWKLSDQNLRPQSGWQYSIGVFKQSKNKRVKTSTEVFYKSMENTVDFKDGAELLLNDKLDADLLQGIGRSYGSEWMIEKEQGRTTGWIAYTLSRTERQIDGNFPEEKINKGKFYPANYDKAHNLSITGSHKISETVSWGVNFVFSSGRPVTYPTSSYGFNGVRVINFDLRNNERSPAYHRLDTSLEIKQKQRPDKKWKGVFLISIYNVYARKNPYTIFFRPSQGVIAESFRLAVLGTIIPSVSYNISF